MRSAMSFGTIASPWYRLQTRCTSSWSIRSSFAWPCSLKEAFIVASASADLSGSASIDAHPATSAAIVAAAAIFGVFMPCSPLALDRGGVEDAAVGVLREEHRERDRRRRHELQFGKTLLSEAIVQSPLEGSHFALGHAVCGPSAVRTLRIGRLGEIGQVLQANALRVAAMAGDASEIVRAAAIEEDRLADLVGL